jgi:hypothetical protein
VIGARPSPRTAPAGVEIAVPRASSTVTPDGELDEAVWTTRAARSGAFVDGAGRVARPYAEARFAWHPGERALYVALYAADEDVRARPDAKSDDPLWTHDAFRIVFAKDGAERALDVSPFGVVTDAKREAGGAWDYRWTAGARAGHDLDGTPNDPSDDDEEWIVEMAIPLAALGLDATTGARTSVAVRRCDTPKSGARACASFGEGTAATLVLE